MKLTASGYIEAADAGRRTITGRIVTWGEVGHTSAGPTVFAAGAIPVTDGVVLCREHDTKSPLGRSVSITAHEAGLDGSFRVAQTTAGNDALVEASEGLRGGFSVGVKVTAHEYDPEGVLIVTAAELDEVSLVTRPAIDSARVMDVAASAPEEGEPMFDTTPDEVVEVVETVEEDTVEVQAAHVPSHIATRTTPRAPQWDSPADYILTYVAAARGDQSAGLKISAANQSQADNPALLPTPIIGNVITFLNTKRPVVTNSRSITMPSAGSQFIRPKVTAHTLVGKQAKEYDALASQAMKVTPINVTKSTYGGSLSVSFQDRDWTEPAIMDLIVTDMAANYGVQTDSAACASLIAGATPIVPLAADADAKATLAALTTAASKIGAAIFDMPDVLYVSFDQWARLASLVDSTGRQVFPFLNPMNAAGSGGHATAMEMNVLGLRVVPDANLAAGTMIMGRSELLETYESIGGQVSVVAPTTLSFTLAYYGYFASTVVESGGFVTLKPGA